MQEIPHEFPRFPGKRAERVDDSILAINLGCLGTCRYELI